MIVRRRPQALTPEELASHLEAGPGDRVAFLPARTTTRQLAETLAAMANANGGLVILGVTARGTPQKEADPRPLCEAVVEAGLLTDPPIVLPSPQVVDTPRGAVVVVQVPPGLPHIYSLQGLYLTRTAGQNRPLTTPELRRLLLERSDTGFEAQLVPGATLEDLDPGRIERYLEQIAFAPHEDVQQVLLARGCIAYTDTGQGFTADGSGRGQLAPTVAGILLFGRDPQRFLRSAEIICVRYPDREMSDEFVRQDITGPLADQARQAEAFVVSNMRRGMKIAGLAREEVTEYPLPVVREAIVNAIAHRDYSIRGEGIRLLMFSDRLEVYSPGRLPGHVTLENLKDERYSRNEAIVAVLSDMGYIERLGYGIDRMIATMQEAGLPEPIFEETAAGFKVTLQSASAELVSPQPEQQPWGHLFLNERQERALAYVQQHGRITNSEYQALAPDVSAETIRRDLADLVEKNLLLRIGEKRATYYILK
ncbi:DeoR family transcriptional regulator [Litorilinea aerophila]|uniref:DeoR family transcriptional regulator n=1 Tax=Litorilinea aerophila TaxID=1204385 RepID=A0A540VHT1_9CHLR|nr:ATP-binding protein [Litorilinea aerophila]MCC9075958.1 DeoR family transcriptional regulator [Litorilinea aerophila]